jgi:hypothetical protein
MPSIGRSIRYIVGTFYERPPDDGKEHPQERSARVTANATRWIAYFTIVLAVAASLQWCESRKQLIAIHADQRPYMGLLNVQDIPRFNATSGQVTWNWAYTNYGKSAAIDLKFSQFMKVADDEYKATYGNQGPSPGGDFPPTKVNWATAFSAPIYRQDDMDRFITVDKAIGILIEMKYTDGYGASYEDRFCMELLKSGAVSASDPKECEKHKRQEN